MKIVNISLKRREIVNILSKMAGNCQHFIEKWREIANILHGPKMAENCEHHNEQVSETGFAAGTSHLTLADLTFLCNFSSLVETNLYPELFEDFPAMKSW
jgi:hypothetical protein